MRPGRPWPLVPIVAPNCPQASPSRLKRQGAPHHHRQQQAEGGNLGWVQGQRAKQEKPQEWTRCSIPPDAEENHSQEGAKCKQTPWSRKQYPHRIKVLSTSRTDGLAESHGLDANIRIECQYLFKSQCQHAAAATSSTKQRVGPADRMPGGQHQASTASQGVDQLSASPSRLENIHLILGCNRPRPAAGPSR